MWKYLYLLHYILWKYAGPPPSTRAFTAVVERYCESTSVLATLHTVKVCWPTPFYLGLYGCCRELLWKYLCACRTTYWESMLAHPFLPGLIYGCCREVLCKYLCACRTTYWESMLFHPLLPGLIRCCREVLWKYLWACRTTYCESMLAHPFLQGLIRLL